MKSVDRKQRIAITGLGIVCSIGRDQQEVWQSILDARAGMGSLTRFPGESFPTSIAAEVAEPNGVRTRRSRRYSRTDRLANHAADEAVKQANRDVRTPLPLARTIVSSGSSTGGLLEGEDYYFARMVRGRRRTPVSRVLQQPTSGPSDAVARHLEAAGGVFSNATACASAGAAIGLAADLLRAGYAGAAVAGGSDALCRLTYSGFNVLQAVDPNPCSPFDESRQGITLGEGAAYLVLERWEDAEARGVTILAELCGYGSTCDAHHPTAPAEDGHGAAAAIRGAVEQSPNGDVAIDYINAHGTGTLLNDTSETRGIISALGTSIPTSSTKSYFGHTLGASGALEAVITVLALRAQIAPPTLRLRKAAEECVLDYIAGVPRPMQMRSAISNTFGFGGSNVSLLFRAAPAERGK
ncbi:MAG TPA: beta-ketoacyl-[acyl-carrier-protein] synthase family protein [Thermoanaerobaculia bacterium]|nr:beta-ketoacyl-[acyl-carrier-protein] synthase family protein [Thermoanaerobaculia bacterium]